MQIIKEKMISWFWDHHVIDKVYHSRYEPHQIVFHLRNSIENRYRLVGSKEAFLGSVELNSFSLCKQDGGEGRSIQMDGRFHSTEVGSIVRVQFKQHSATDEGRMTRIVVVLIDSIMTMGMGYDRFGLFVFLSSVVYWILHLGILKAIFELDLRVSANALREVLELQSP